MSLQNVTESHTAEAGVWQPATADQRTKDFSEWVSAGTEPLAGTLWPTEGTASGPGHLNDQTGQPLWG